MSQLLTSMRRCDVVVTLWRRFSCYWDNVTRTSSEYVISRRLCNVDFRCWLIVICIICNLFQPWLVTIMVTLQKSRRCCRSTITNWMGGSNNTVIHYSTYLDTYLDTSLSCSLGMNMLGMDFLHNIKTAIEYFLVFNMIQEKLCLGVPNTTFR